MVYIYNIVPIILGLHIGFPISLYTYLCILYGDYSILQKPNYGDYIYHGDLIMETYILWQPNTEVLYYQYI